MNNIEKLTKVCEELITFVNDKFNHALQKTSRESYLDGVSYFLFARNYKTFNALYLLCVNSYGQDALALSRSIFECFINLAYILQKNSEKRAKLFALDSLLKNRALIQEAISKNYEPNYFNTEILKQFNDKNDNLCKEAITLQSEEKENLKKEKNITNWNRNQWSGISLRTMARFIGLADFYCWGPYFLLSNQAHANGGSSAEYISISGIFNDEVAGKEAIEKSLIMGYDFILRTVHAIDTVFDLGFRERIEQFEEYYSGLVD